VSAVRRWLHRLWNAIAPHRADTALSREVDAHLRLIQDDLERRGLSPDEARRAARRALGGVEPSKRAHSDARSFVWLDDLRRDTDYAVRSLLRAPGFTAVAVVTLALGIGANTAIFSIVDHVLLRSLPLPHADRLVRLYESNPAVGRPREGPSPPNVVDWRRAATSFDLMATIGGISLTMSGAADPETVVAMLVGPEFFSLTGVTLALGQPFAPAAYQSVANAAIGPVAIREPASDAATVILSHALWQRQFGADPSVVGRIVAINGNPAAVVGVMPADFRFDDITAWGRADCWLPMVESRIPFRRGRQYPAIGRLKPGVTVETAQAEMTVIAANLAKAYPSDDGGWGVYVEPLRDSLTAEARATLLILLGGVACVLLVACANVANLLLMRSAGRSREMAVRMAIGAGRSRLVRQWLTEGALLGVLGGLAGLAVAVWAVPILVARAPLHLPRLDAITVDGRVFAFTLGASLAIGLLCGLAPALGARRIRLASLRSTAPLGAAGGHRWLRLSLVVAQVGLAIVLLVGAGLMARTLMAVRSRDLGFDPSHVLTFGVSPRRSQSLDAVLAFSRDLIDRLQALPGVEAAGVGGVPLLGGLSVGYAVDGPDQPITARTDISSAGYLRSLRIRLQSGRLFSDADTAAGERVAIVNLAFARRVWRADDVVGRQLRVESTLAGKEGASMTVVGVVDNVRASSLEADAPPIVYLPYLQSTVGTSTNYVVRTTGDPSGALSLVRDAVRSLDPLRPLTRVATMDERVGRLLAPREFNLWLTAVFSALALLLAVIGVYGLVSEAVTSRTPEIGVRMALGAGRFRVVRLVMGSVVLVTVAGTALGLVAAAFAARSLGSMIFGVRPLDPVTLVVVPLVFVAAAIVATLGPARRATRVDPVVALRGD
jgi:putative ABC transport system permease protein